MGAIPFAVKLLIMVVLVAVAYLSRPGAQKSGRLGLEVNQTDPMGPARIVMGFIKAGGYYVIPPWATGDGGKYMHLVIALAGHPIDGFGEIFIGTQRLTPGKITAVNGNSSDGVLWDDCGTQDWRGGADGWVESGVGWGGWTHWIRRYKGTQTAADYILTQDLNGTILSNFVGHGIAYAAIKMMYCDKNNRGSLLQFTFEMRGTPVYDPRLDSTQPHGVGLHRYYDRSTWQYRSGGIGTSSWKPQLYEIGRNPALLAAWYLCDPNVGMGYDPATEIDWDTVWAAAAICDELVDAPGGYYELNGLPVWSVPRYQCNIVLEATADLLNNLSSITDCMMGFYAQVDGKWKIWAGSWQTPPTDNEIEYKDFVGPVTIQCSAPRNSQGTLNTERYNGVRVSYTEAHPGGNWQRKEAAPRTSDAYKALDGDERIWKSVDVQGCTDEFQAQRIGEFVLRQSRNQIVVQGALGPQWMRLSTFETLTLTWPDMGWNAKTFRLMSYSVHPNGLVQVALREEQASDWTDLNESDYGVPITQSPPASQIVHSGTPTYLTATSYYGFIEFEFDHPNPILNGVEYVLYESADTNFAHAVEILSTYSTACTVQKGDEIVRYYWIGARDKDTHVSTFPAQASPGVSGYAKASHYIITCWVAGKPTSNEVLITTTITQACTFNVNFAGSYASSGATATASTTFNIHKNGGLVGTLNFAATSGVGTFSSGADVPCVAGDTIDIKAPPTPDATLADITITLQASMFNV